MPYEIVKQAKKRGLPTLYARWSTVVMGNTHVDLTAEQMISALMNPKEIAFPLAQEQARRLVTHAKAANPMYHDHRSGDL